MRDILENPQKYKDIQLDLSNVVHELAGHRAFEEFAKAKMDPLDRLNHQVMEKELHKINESRLYNPNDPVTTQKYLKSPQELAAEFIANRAGLSKAAQEIKHLESQGKAVPEATKEQLSKLQQYSEKLDQAIEKRTDKTNKFWFDTMREYADKTYGKAPGTRGGTN
jgi:hypothetical protein